MQTVPADRLKDAFLDEVRKVKKFFYGTVIAQAQRIDVENDRVVFTFGPQHRPLKSQLEQQRPLLETIAAQLSGRKMSIVAAEGAPPPPNRPGAATTAGTQARARREESRPARAGAGRLGRPGDARRLRRRNQRR